MATCPECNQEISYLRNFSKVWQEFKLFITEDGDEDFEDADNLISCGDQDDFECPECGRVLFRDFQEAVGFLKGEQDAEVS